MVEEEKKKGFAICFACIRTNENRRRPNVANPTNESLARIFPAILKEKGEISPTNPFLHICRKSRIRREYLNTHSGESLSDHESKSIVGYWLFSGSFNGGKISDTDFFFAFLVQQPEVTT